MDSFNDGISYIWQIMSYPLFNIGQVEISFITILKLIVALWILSWLSKKLRDLLVKRLLLRYNEDIGVRQAIGSIARYIFIILGLFVIFQASGIDLSGLALLGGALGVGIGFGLQSITNNFVSGLVILLERPVKVGDRIEVGGTTGDVVSIKARATTVVTNDGISVIIPNSEFISSRVINWSFTGSRMIRFKIPVPAPYGSDQEQIIKLLLEVAKEDPNVALTPEPTVRLREFAASSLVFELVIWTSKLMQRQGMMNSRINMAVYKKFREHNITLPLPAVDVNLKNPGVQS